MLRVPEKLNALPAPTTSSALEEAITMGEESAKLLSRKVTWGRVGVKVRVRVSVRVRRGLGPESGPRLRRELGLRQGLGLGLGSGHLSLVGVHAARDERARDCELA